MQFFTFTISFNKPPAATTTSNWYQLRPLIIVVDAHCTSYIPHNNSSTENRASHLASIKYDCSGIVFHAEYLFHS